jgi:protein-S-isoprenylcysteine O-methyltransferase Ste14
MRTWIAHYVGEASPAYWPLWAVVAGWLVYTIYWEASARKRAPTQSSESRRSRKLHVVLANIALILILVPVQGLRQRCLPASFIVAVPGLAIEAVGLVLALWARRCLGRNWSGEIAIKVHHELVRTGPYRVVRHPIYTGLLGMYVGPSLVSGELHAMLGLALATFAYLRKTRLEEAALIRCFGADYGDYRRATWALLPGVF